MGRPSRPCSLIPGARLLAMQHVEDSARMALHVPL